MNKYLIIFMCALLPGCGGDYSEIEGGEQINQFADFAEEKEGIYF